MKKRKKSDFYNIETQPSCRAGCDIPVDARDVVQVGAAAGTQQDGHVRLRR